MQSEQLASRFYLAANEHGAAGLFLQKMPSTDERDADGWPRIEALAQTVRDDELLGLAPEALLTRLFHEETVRVFTPQAVTNNSPEDWEKVSNMLRALGREDVYSVIKDRGVIVIRGGRGAERRYGVGMRGGADCRLRAGDGSGRCGERARGSLGRDVGGRRRGKNGAA